MDDYHDFALDGNTSTLVTMLRTSLSRYYLRHPREFLLASAGAFYARNIGRMLRGPDAAASHIAEIAIDR